MPFYTHEALVYFCVHLIRPSRSADVRHGVIMSYFYTPLAIRYYKF